MGVLLDGEGWVFEEGKVLHLGGVVQIDQDTGLFAFLGLKNGLEKTDKIKGWEFIGNLE